MVTLPPNPRSRLGSSFLQLNMAVSGRLRSQILPSAPFDCSQCDCDNHKDQKGGSNIAHVRARSAQCTSATPNAIAIQGVIILASCEMTEGITPFAVMPPSVSHAARLRFAHPIFLVSSSDVVRSLAPGLPNY